MKKDLRKAAKKTYQKPRLMWEEKLEPVAFQISPCAKKPLTSPKCQAAPQY